MKAYSISVDIIDPWVKPFEAKSVYGLSIYDSVEVLGKQTYGVVISAVSHSEFSSMKKQD